MSLEDLLFFAIFIAIALRGVWGPWLKRRRRHRMEAPLPVGPQQPKNSTADGALPPEVREALSLSVPVQATAADAMPTQAPRLARQDAAISGPAQTRAATRGARNAALTRGKPGRTRGPSNGPRNLAEARRGVVLATVLGPCLGADAPPDAASHDTSRR